MNEKRKRASVPCHMVRITDEVYMYLMLRGHTGETFDDVLRRDLGLPENETGKQSAVLRKLLNEHVNKAKKSSKFKEIMQELKPPKK